MKLKMLTDIPKQNSNNYQVNQNDTQKFYRQVRKGDYTILMMMKATE